MDQLRAWVYWSGVVSGGLVVAVCWFVVGLAWRDRRANWFAPGEVAGHLARAVIASAALFGWARVLSPTP